jgi:hypothetical protein
MRFLQKPRGIIIPSFLSTAAFCAAISPFSLHIADSEGERELAAVLYYDPDPKEKLTYQDGSWVAPGKGKELLVLKYRVSPETGHVLITGDRRIDLSGKARGPGMLVQISLEKRS